jgi:hypothetical protein
VLCAAALALGCGDSTDDDADSGSAADAAVESDGGDDDVSWREAFDAEDLGAFLSVWGTSPEDVYVVGGQPEVGVAYHFDGERWEPLPTPDGPLLNWVYGVGDSIWMVGNGGRALRRRGDGDFEATETGTTAPLWGVWGSAPDDVWAVGGDARDPESEPVLLHWTGEAPWAAVELPELDRDARALFKVWGTGSDHVFAVGSRGVILYFDGERVSQQDSGTANDLISLWGTGPDDIAVAGGRSNGELARWDGQRWQTETLLGLPGLNGVWLDGGGTAHVVGVRGTVARVSPGGFAFEAEESGTTLVLHGVWGVDDGPRWAVGGSLNSSPPYQGIVLVDR